MNILSLLALFNLTGNVWAILSRALPAAVSLVKGLDSLEGMSGKEKFQKVLTGVNAELDKEGFIVDPKFDAVLNFSIELALMITRWGTEEKVQSIKPKAKRQLRPLVPGRP